MFTADVNAVDSGNRYSYVDVLPAVASSNTDGNSEYMSLQNRNKNETGKILYKPYLLISSVLKF